MTKVLVVDDDPSLLKALRIGLTARGDEVAHRAHGSGGHQPGRAGRPDLVILDLGLPDIDGIEVCRRIREFSQVPIVVLSAYGDERRKVEALDAGADDFVTKPFGMAELEARLRVALRHGVAARGDGDDEVADPEVGDLDVDLVHHMATLAGRTVAAHRQGVRAAGLPGPPCRQGVHPPHDPQGRLGSRLRRRVELRPGLHPSAAQEAGRRRRAGSCGPCPAIGYQLVAERSPPASRTSRSG